jgi:hypothetical protein
MVLHQFPTESGPALQQRMETAASHDRRIFNVFDEVKKPRQLNFCDREMFLEPQVIT